MTQLPLHRQPDFFSADPASSIDSRFRDFKDKSVCQYLAERSTNIHIDLYIIHSVHLSIRLSSCIARKLEMVVEKCTCKYKTA
jgi:hypothetical protein